VTITKSVTIVAPAGVHAAIAPSSGNAITVSAADTDHVVLRNLYLNAQGASIGIDINSVAAVYVESCVVSGFTSYGIFFDPSTPGARLYVSDSAVRRTGFAGIRVLPGGGGLRVTLDAVRLHGNDTGVLVSSAEATIRDSVASGEGNLGFSAISGSKIMVENSVSTGNALGFYADSGGVMIMSRCAASSNTDHGVFAFGSGTVIYVSDSTIAGNAVGVAAMDGGIVTSRGNNTLQANTTNGAFTSTFAPN